MAEVPGAVFRPTAMDGETSVAFFAEIGAQGAPYIYSTN